MNRNLKEGGLEEEAGKTPWFLKLAFLALILWAVLYLWRNLFKSFPSL